MTKGYRPILRRVDAYLTARVRERAQEAEERRQAEAAAVAAAQQQELRRMRAAQHRQRRGRRRRTVAQAKAREEQDRKNRMARQQGAAAELRARAQARRDARMMVEAFEANRRYEIERIIARRTNVTTREYEYLIRWRGFGSERDQWRPRSALVADGVGSMVDEFDTTQSSAAAFGPGGFSKAFTSNGKHDSSRGGFIGRNDTSVAAADSSSSSDSDSSSSSDSDSMDSADDDDDDDSEHPSDDDDDDQWWSPPTVGARVERYDDGASARLYAPSLLRRLHINSKLFEGVQSASDLCF